MSSRFQIGRRDFLVLSSTAALGVAASGFGSELLRFGAPRPFSVGFTDGTHRLVSADGLSHDIRGDSARMIVDGFWSGDDVPRSTAVAAYFRHHGDDLPFLAWAHVHGANARAPRGSFRVPVHDGALALGFESRERLTVGKPDALIAAANDREAVSRCALQARRGTYVVAFGEKPNWRALELRTGDKPLGNVSFDYLVFTVANA